jgi:hypothetical protein
MSQILKTETQDYFFCPRCNKDSVKNEWCPCPRGGCEARISGTITTTVTLDETLSPEQEKWNKDNYRN